MQFGLTGRLGQAPVDHEGLTVAADDDVARFDVAMEDATTVGILNGVAYISEAPEETTKLERSLARIALQLRIFMKAVNRLFQAVSLDEAHCVVRPAVAVRSEPINRHDSGMLKPAGDFGLQQEA